MSSRLIVAGCSAAISAGLFFAAKLCNAHAHDTAAVVFVVLAVIMLLAAITALFPRFMAWIFELAFDVLFSWWA